MMAAVLKDITHQNNCINSSKIKKNGCSEKKKQEHVKLAKGLSILVTVPNNLDYLVPSSVIDIKENGLIHVSTGPEVYSVDINHSQLFLCGADNFVHSSDLTKLQILNHGSVLHCIRCRYNANIYYTSAGCTLVAVNPFQNLPHLYADDVIFKYQKKTTKNLPPHIYQVAAKAYTNMEQECGKINQSIIVSGESGAGKTCSARFLIKYLTTISKSSKCQHVNEIDQKILQSTPILEAFGNAATIHNHNSSRFGKFIQLQFIRNELLGAKIQTFLLEKTRVVYQNPKERNFHIFYQMLNGCTKEEKVAWLIPSELSFTVIPFQSLQQDIDIEAWRNTRKAMADIGLSKDHQNSIFKIVSAILHLCNVTFMEDQDTGVSDLNDQNKVCLESLHCAANLLGISHSSLINTMTVRRISAAQGRRQSVVHKPCSEIECQTRRDCMAKFLYDRLFDWLTQFINQCLSAVDHIWKHFIGILDVYGFESFENNSLEQLCINYANEKLQQYFVKHFLKDEQQIYQDEGLPWSLTEYSDNRSCLELLEGKIGIFSLLDEECRLNRPSNAHILTERIVQTLGSHPKLSRSKPKKCHSEFIISHYVTDVNYDSDGIVDKNKDNIPFEVVELLKKSANKFLQDLLTANSQSTLHSNSCSSNRKPTVLSKFKASLDHLMKTLELSEPQYVRCIKPNRQCQAALLDGQFVMNQLQACGVLETVTISKSGYPTKMLYSDFVQRYSIFLHPILTNRSLPGLNIAKTENIALINFLKQLELSHFLPRTSTPIKVLRRRTGLSNRDHLQKLVIALVALVLGPHYVIEEADQVYFGQTRVFLKDKQIEQLEVIRAKFLSQSAFTIQCWWRRLQQQKARLKTKAAITIQSAFKMWILRKHWLKTRQAVIVIQKAYQQYVNKKQRRQFQEEQLHKTSKLFISELQPVFTLSPKTEFALVTCNQCRGIVNITCQCELITSVSVRPKTRALCAMLDNIMANHTIFDMDINLTNIESNNKACSYKPRSLRILLQNESNREQRYQRLPHLFYWDGLLSIRRMPKVNIRFHTRITPLPYSHYLPLVETQCSLTDVLDVESSV